MNKVVRLQNGRFITKKIRESDPRELAEARPEDVWTTADGAKLLIRDMETTHILNVLRQLYERAHNKMKQSGLELVTDKLSDVIQSGPEYMARVDRVANDMFPQYMPMKLEMEIRVGKRQREAETVKPSGRGFTF